MNLKRLFVAICTASVATFSLVPMATAQSGQVVVANMGGTWGDVVRETIWKPFERETGIKVVAAVGQTLPKMRAMVNSGSPEWDVVEIDGGELEQLTSEGMLQQIDYNSMNRSLLSDFPKDAIRPFGMGSFRYARVLAFNTKNFTQANRPRNWADMWNVKQFPGLRVLDAGDYVVPPIELALLADGVPPEKLYPLDFKRAYATLSRIKPNVLKWSTAPATTLDALVSGEAVMGAMNQGRIQSAKEQGAPVDYTWNQALTDDYYWAILKGSRNEVNARKFIEFASRPEIQAAVVKKFVAGPRNRKAFDFIAPDRAKLLPTYPENASKTVARNPVWWGQKDASGKSNQNVNAAMWNAWILKE
jgi:putative spermidine/putrescine transport system substrate-binding protein